MGRVRKHYTLEFKLAALRLAETSGKSLVALERELGLSDGCLYQWRRQLADKSQTDLPTHGRWEERDQRLPQPERKNALVIPAAQRRTEIAERVRIARQHKQFTQSDIARLLCCSRKRVNDVEKGLSTLSAIEIDMLSEALGVPHEFFFRTV